VDFFGSVGSLCPEKAWRMRDRSRMIACSGVMPHTWVCGGRESEENGRAGRVKARAKGGKGRLARCGSQGTAEGNHGILASALPGSRAWIRFIEETRSKAVQQFGRGRRVRVRTKAGTGSVFELGAMGLSNQGVGASGHQGVGASGHHGSAGVSAQEADWRKPAVHGFMDARQAVQCMAMQGGEKRIVFPARGWTRRMAKRECSGTGIALQWDQRQDG
jgi:hypothetical protein